MARNIEIKARVQSLAGVREKAVGLASSPIGQFTQVDTFFAVPAGRLKVREFSGGHGELIAYERPDVTGPKQSTYSRVACADAAALARALGSVLAVRGCVVKRREVILVGRTRIHLDEVERLGAFVELEVVLAEGEDAASGEREAQQVMAALGISPEELVGEAYIDLLERSGKKTGSGAIFSKNEKPPDPDLIR